MASALIQFSVVHDDKFLVVVDKSAGVLTVPTLKRERNTLVDLVGKHLRRELIVIHRLDRETSGLLVFAKDERTARALMDHWHEHERIYVAIVHGLVTKESGVVDTRLVTGKNLDRRSSRDGRGERAVTHYRVLERLRAATFVEVTLETGKRNQIRVHMKDLGHPILGDDRYARDHPRHPQWRGGLALHARTLAFIHPVTREKLMLDAGIPAAFQKFLEAARARS